MRIKDKAEVDGKGGVTLIFCHGNGFNKEMWEETIRELLKQFSDIGDGDNSRGGGKSMRIDEIFTIDHYNQGESWFLNKEVLSERVSWADCVSSVLAIAYLLYLV